MPSVPGSFPKTHSSSMFPQPLYALRAENLGAKRGAESLGKMVEGK